MSVRIPAAAPPAAKQSTQKIETAEQLAKTPEGKAMVRQTLTDIAAQITKEKTDTDGTQFGTSTWSVSEEKDGTFVLTEKNPDVQSNVDRYQIMVKGDAVRVARTDVMQFNAGAWVKEVLVKDPKNLDSLQDAIQLGVLVGEDRKRTPPFKKDDFQNA